MSKGFTDNPKKEVANWVALVIAISILFVANMAIIAEGNAALTNHHKTIVGDWFQWRGLDIVGLFMFDFNIIALVGGFFGFWSLREEIGGFKYGILWAVLLLASIGIILLL